MPYPYSDSNSPLWDLQMDILKSPITILKSPFTAYKKYYGKPKATEVYKGTFLQRQRLKRILPNLFKGKEINPDDRDFMNMFNNFLTGEGRQPVDQRLSTMNCKDCTPYIYEKREVVEEPKKGKKEQDKKVADRLQNGNVFNVSFGDELKPKNATNSFGKNKMYKLTLIGKSIGSNSSELYLRNNFLEKDDYLIFKIGSSNPLDRPLDFKVFQNNMKRPLRQQIELGKIAAKIE